MHDVISHRRNNGIYADIIILYVSVGDIRVISVDFDKTIAWNSDRQFVTYLITDIREFLITQL